MISDLRAASTERGLHGVPSSMAGAERKPWPIFPGPAGGVGELFGGMLEEA